MSSGVEPLPAHNLAPQILKAPLAAGPLVKVSAPRGDDQLNKQVDHRPHPAYAQAPRWASRKAERQRSLHLDGSMKRRDGLT